MAGPEYDQFADEARAAIAEQRREVEEYQREAGAFLANSSNEGMRVGQGREPD